MVPTHPLTNPTIIHHLPTHPSTYLFTQAVHVVKIDAEGFDGRILMGMRGLLREKRVDVVT
jgi:hypothetical protein